MSNIDPTVPIYGFPTTASVRDNFQIAHDEISTLQAEVAALQGEVETDEGLYLPLIGGTLTGPLTIDGAYLDVVAPPGAFGYLTISRDAGQAALLVGLTDGKTRWYVNIANGTPETGSGAGSDFSIQRFDDNGNYLADALTITRATGLVQLTAPLTVTKNVTSFAPPGSAMLTLQAADNAANSIIMYTFGITSEFNPSIGMRRAYGTAAAPLAVTINGVLGSWSGLGHDGTSYGAAATITLIADDNLSPTSHAGRVLFQTCPIGSTTLATVMTLTNSGALLIGPNQITTAAYKLDVTGTGRFDTGTGTLPTLPQAPTLVLSSGDNVLVQTQLVGFSAATTMTPQILFVRARNTRAAPQALTLASTMGWVGATGYGATGFASAARAYVSFITDENWSDTAQGTDITIWTTPTGTIVPAEVARFNSQGQLLIEIINSGAYKLDVSGNSRITGTLTTTGSAGFNGSAPPAKPTVTGAKGSNAALASLLTALVSYGLVTDTTTA